ncbi:MAG: hypothetical protein A2X59_09660 [Nitrospirae bacterium GWC2_42_7]|nr:MAG: hypothetical protein A2X59_09660 [Nitrospirae bacterium GWC2_42_7]
MFSRRRTRGFRKGGYEAYTTTGGFRKGVEILEGIVSKGTSVIVCAERFPWKCHRWWILRKLHKHGWQIEHIIDKGKVWMPKG